MEYPFYNIIWSCFYWQVQWLLIKTRRAERYTEKNVLRLHSMSPFCTSRSKRTLSGLGLLLSLSLESSPLSRERAVEHSLITSAQSRRKWKGRNKDEIHFVYFRWSAVGGAPFFALFSRAHPSPSCCNWKLHSVLPKSRTHTQERSGARTRTHTHAHEGRHEGRAKGRSRKANEQSRRGSSLFSALCVVVKKAKTSRARNRLINYC